MEGSDDELPALFEDELVLAPAPRTLASANGWKVVEEVQPDGSAMRLPDSVGQRLIDRSHLRATSNQIMAMLVALASPSAGTAMLGGGGMALPMALLAAGHAGPIHVVELHEVVPEIFVSPRFWTETWSMLESRGLVAVNILGCDRGERLSSLISVAVASSAAPVDALLLEPHDAESRSWTRMTPRPGVVILGCRCVLQQICQGGQLAQHLGHLAREVLHDLQTHRGPVGSCQWLSAQKLWRAVGYGGSCSCAQLGVVDCSAGLMDVKKNGTKPAMQHWVFMHLHEEEGAWGGGTAAELEMESDDGVPLRLQSALVNLSPAEGRLSAEAAAGSERIASSGAVNHQQPLKHLLALTAVIYNKVMWDEQLDDATGPWERKLRVRFQLPLRGLG
eukprot:Skav218466  [mRNA]  locus=scaffold538:876634:892829:+ [translate_table: standard]